MARLDRDDAVKLVERVVNEDASTGVGDATRTEIEDLVEAVNGHARTLALLAPSLRRDGVIATRERLVELMAEMERRFPGDREQSLFASVELSLRRLSPGNRDRARVLGLFQGGVNLRVLGVMMRWEDADLALLAGGLVETGLATPNRYNHLTLNPALGPYLRSMLDDTDLEALTLRWVDAMRRCVDFLYEQCGQNAELAATLTVLELPNLFALLAHVSRAGDAEAIIELATNLQSLLKNLGRPRLLARVAETRDAAAARIGATWNHARFEAERNRIDEQLAAGPSPDALAAAQGLLTQAHAAGEQAYRGADYDLASAYWLLGRALQMTGRAQQGLPHLEEAQLRFEAIAQASSERTPARMASICLTDKGDCLLVLGRLDEAAAMYEESNRGAAQQGDERRLAVGKANLGSVRLRQRRYRDALEAYAEAHEHFTKLAEPRSVAAAWHQTGVAYRAAKQPEEAEDAFRKSLAIEVPLGNVESQAGTLTSLGALYGDLGRLEEAASLFRNAADQYVAISDTLNEGRCRSNLGNTLHRLGRWEEARQAIHRAIECNEPFGHEAEPWFTWAILADIETDDGNASAAAQARAKAVTCYLAYRRDGGENHNADGRLSLVVTEKLRAGDAAGAASILDQLSSHPELPDWLRPFVAALQAMAAGSRDQSLAEAPDLYYRSAAELLYLIEVLELPR